jgi:hypothetical protein
MDNSAYQMPPGHFPENYDRRRLSQNIVAGDQQKSNHAGGNDHVIAK